MAFDLAQFLGGSIGDAVVKIVGLFKVSPDKQLEAATELAKIQLELQGKILDQVQGQLDVNKTEAASSNWFVAGWRPFVGWICGAALASQYIVGPFFEWATNLAGHPTKWPTIDYSTLLSILGGMLGLAGMRTYEKVQNIPGSDKIH